MMSPSYQRVVLSLFSLLSFAAAAPKLYICSDSTTANYTTGVLQGWGYYIGDYLSIGVSNQARNGRSTRSFINEGLWSTLLSTVVSGDFVVIEMGHNDDGDPTTSDRATLSGIANNSVAVTTTTGANETVHSFGWYLRKMIVDIRAKNAVPILSGMVNRNYWTGEVLQSSWAFADYAQAVAVQTGVEYLDHTKYSVKRWQSLGSVVAKTYFPNDNTHTNAAGAVINAETFVTAVKCESPASHLVGYLNSAGKALTHAC